MKKYDISHLQLITGHLYMKLEKGIRKG